MMYLMARGESLFPAPGRGQYDRRAPREQRLAEQRERLLAATTRVAASEAVVSAASIVRLAGVGRNTFYEYFDDARHAEREAQIATLRRIEQALRDAEGRARTPVERWRELIAAWLALAAREPDAMLLALQVPTCTRRELSPGAELFAEALQRSLEGLRAFGLAVSDTSRERVIAVAAAGEALARARALGENAEEPAARGEADKPSRVEAELVAVAVRLLR